MTDPHPSAEKKWYAVYTRPRAEKLVLKRLQQEDVEAYLPLMKTLKVWSDRKKMVEKPLLTSYVFVKTTQKGFPIVFQIDGIVKFVTFESIPVSIPQRQIDVLRLLIDSEAELEVTGEKFEKGDSVEVIAGSLTGLTGELINVNGTKRVIVRIDRLDQNILLKIPAAFLKKV